MNPWGDSHGRLVLLRLSRTVEDGPVDPVMMANLLWALAGLAFVLLGLTVVVFAVGLGIYRELVRIRKSLEDLARPRKNGS
jgi:hypothetical protein